MIESCNGVGSLGRERNQRGRDKLQKIQAQNETVRKKFRRRSERVSLYNKVLTFKANLPVTENPSPQDKRSNRLSLVENSSSRAAVNVRKGAISFPGQRPKCIWSKSEITHDKKDPWSWG